MMVLLTPFVFKQLPILSQMKFFPYFHNKKRPWVSIINGFLLFWFYVDFLLPKKVVDLG